ncbi:PAS domain S-box-containing protein/diguanylate cyclase (GGDEF)-like protein [Paenibacillus cellulosilyticus]|uniref:PAS domain S-box-containing protein/diguanylate cyclase (GGDEF)-like protein n=1 Tax=Paenibacillus cellulosilyticus TaxID=375489 RepID=A0A2V2YU26_9BACL|nr:sensor domain-containing diguanylate cyclase [Paenibacillus cellulosilyticus]PWV99353.1 PAS domain S-box-containing protein/diguanylate cyclase (GGDEF)-like protein [Paenibacillus cellulosilyticus]QKS45116.1 PAS domain S-box protein [Paenibacillus cellulosilyticus]
MPHPIFISAAVVLFIGLVSAILYAVKIHNRKKHSEQLLIESERKYRALVEHAVDMFFVNEFDRERMPFIEVNELVYRLLGYSRQELDSMSPIDLCVQDPLLLKRFMLHRKQLAKTGFVHYTTKLQSKDGKVIPVDANAKLIEWNGKRVVITILRDISESYATELALSESEERYRRLIELLPDAVGVIADGAVVFLNRSGARMFGADSPSVIIGMSFLDFVHPEYHTMVCGRVNDILADQLPSEPLEINLYRLDGSMFYGMVQSTPIIYRGKPSVLVVVHDITQRKLTEQTLQESEEQYRRMFELSPYAICLLNMNGKIVFVNDKAVELFEADSYSSLVGINQMDIISPAYQEESKARFQSIIRRDFSGLTYENHFVTLHGNPFIAEISVTCVQYEGEIVVLAHIQDISQRKEEEEQLQETNRLLKKLSTIDGLTGISNRRHFEEALEKEWEASSTYSKPCSVIMFDIDYFKRYNDTYGHQGGDACLKDIASSIKRLVKRTGGVFARYGGEEFVILLPRTNAHESLHLAERIEQQVAALRIRHAGSKVSDRVTVSIGVATMIAAPGLKREELIEQADRALYQAKLAGRNQIVMSDSQGVLS